MYTNSTKMFAANDVSQLFVFSHIQGDWNLCYRDSDTSEAILEFNFDFLQASRK